MGRVRSSWWGEEFIMDEIALKGSDHHNFVWVCVSFVSRSVSDSAECPNPISHNHHPNTFSCVLTAPEPYIQYIHDSIFSDTEVELRFPLLQFPCSPACGHSRDAGTSPPKYNACRSSAAREISAINSSFGISVRDVIVNCM